MKIKKYIVNNFGLKVTALCMAFFVWVLVSGKERSYSERTLEISVEYFNVAPNIDVRNVRPEKVRLKVRGTSKELEKITPEDFKIKINLKDVSEGTRLNYFSEDYLQSPDGMKITSVHPRMIEITVKEFITKEVSIRVKYKGKMKKGVRLVERRLVPEKVKIFGYKSQIGTITTVEATEFVNLSKIERSKSIKIPLKKKKEILRFEGTDEVEVFIIIENLNKTKNESKKGK